MSFYDVYSKYKDYDFENLFSKFTEEDVLEVINKDNIDVLDYLKLLSPAGEKYIEEMAKKAHELSLKHFGKAIILYTPIYLSNYCVNKCAYCSYNIENEINRKTMTSEEIEEEAKAISSTGLRHILILTGESKKEVPISYIKESVKIMKKYFDSISIEIYPLSEDEYKEVIEAGVDGLTIYQEVYNEEIYKNVHIAGPKRDYRFRLDAAERACKNKIRSVNIGALLGLNDWRIEAFMTGMHAMYLQNKYSDVEISISLPRIKPHVGYFNNIYPVNDKNLVQIILATRIFMPFTGITISTREKKELRDNLIPLGITKMSAGVTTEVGGHALENKGDSQFEISDGRTVHEMKKAIVSKGYQAVFKDWVRF